MKTSAFCVLAFLLSVNVMAQVSFCPPGAAWNYLFQQNNLSYYNEKVNEKVSYVRDSVIGPDTLKVLRHTKSSRRFNYPTYLTLIKQIGNTILFRNRRTDHTWQILYDFGADVNDTWPVFLDGSAGAAFGVTVKAKYDTTVNGKALKKMRVLVEYNMNFTEELFFVERLGADQFLFFFHAPEISDGDVFMQNLCYTDTDLGIVSYGSLSCDFENLSGVQERSNGESLFFPNPVDDHLILKNTNALNRYELLDISGRLCAEPGVVREGANAVHTLAPGVYFLRITGPGGLTQVRKFLKL